MPPSKRWKRSSGKEKFLLGGNIRDPLNLNSLSDEKVAQMVNAVTPESSPIPTPKHKKAEYKIEVFIPPNISDPLSLMQDGNDDDYDASFNKKKTRPNPPGSSENKTTRLITLIPAGSAPNADRPATPNILKRKPTTAVSLAPKRPMISTTTFAVTTLPSSTSSERPSPPSVSADSAGNGYPPQTQFPDIDHSPLSLLAEEASRRTPSLNLSPSTTLDVPLDPKFIGGPIIAGSKMNSKFGVLY